jgi:hypothetical protein
MPRIFEQLSGLVDRFLSSSGQNMYTDQTLEMLRVLWAPHLVYDPADAVLSDYGISIGVPPDDTFPTVPDVLLAFIDVECGRWYWPKSSGVAHNLHCPSSVSMPCAKAYPIWITVGDMKQRKRLIQRMKHIDIFGYILQNRRCMFWKMAFREFIETTWHPTRVKSWCFDQEDLEYF